VSRVLSLDHDGAVFDEIGRRDPVIGRLQDLAPGLRHDLAPGCFGSGDMTVRGPGSGLERNA